MKCSTFKSRLFRGTYNTAFAYGYADLASFSKAFKQAFGQSPSQFIK
jgi:AraC-like DNA-binding protein